MFRDGPLEFVAAALGLYYFHIASYFAVQIRALNGEYCDFSREYPVVIRLCCVNLCLQWAEPMQEKVRLFNVRRSNYLAKERDERATYSALAEFSFVMSTRVLPRT